MSDGAARTAEKIDALTADMSVKLDLVSLKVAELKEGNRVIRAEQWVLGFVLAVLLTLSSVIVGAHLSPGF